MTASDADHVRRARLWLYVLAAIVLPGSVLAAVVLDDPPLPVDSWVQIGPAGRSAPIRPGFVGLSLEYTAVSAYTGTDPRAVNPVFEQLLRNLAPNQARVLRIGGDSSDITWWPTRTVKPPPGVTYSLSANWLRTTRALAEDVNARLILGVDLEAGQPQLARAEARALLSGIGRPRVQALELGNEGNRYPTLPWYRTARRLPVFARPPGYDFRAFTADFTRVRKLLGPVPVAGPTVGGFEWLAPLRGFLAADPTVRVVTFHRYPLNRCFAKRGSPRYASVANLLLPRSSRGLAQGTARFVAIAHRHGALFRVDEMNSVACAGKLGVSNTFAAALWALDAIFSLARAGVDGVNVHTFPTAGYQLFTFRHAAGRWSASVRPEYYGLVLFARAAPPGSRLLNVEATGTSAVRAWATRARDGTERLLLINADPDLPHVAQIAGATPNPAALGTLERLSAASAYATSGVALAGQTFAPTSGRLGGPHQVTRVRARRGHFKVTLPAASAALLTIPAER